MEDKQLDVLEQLEDLIDKSFTTEELNKKLNDILKVKKDYINDEYVWDDVREYNEQYIEDEFSNYVDIVIDEVTGIEYVADPNNTYSLYVKDYNNIEYQIVYKIKDYDNCIITVWDVQ